MALGELLSVSTDVGGPITCFVEEFRRKGLSRDSRLLNDELRSRGEGGDVSGDVEHSAGISECRRSTEAPGGRVEVLGMALGVKPEAA